MRRTTRFQTLSKSARQQPLSSCQLILRATIRILTQSISGDLHGKPPGSIPSLVSLVRKHPGNLLTSTALLLVDKVNHILHPHEAVLGSGARPFGPPWSRHAGAGRAYDAPHKLLNCVPFPAPQTVRLGARLCRRGGVARI